MREYFLAKYEETGPLATRVRKPMYRNLLYWSCVARDPLLADWAIQRMTEFACPVGLMDRLYARGASFRPLREMLCGYRNFRNRMAQAPGTQIPPR
jgi:hypothetical protein